MLFVMAVRFALLFAYLYISGCSADSDRPRPVVEAKFGKVLGRTVTINADKYIKRSKNVDVFRSIPYAEAPVGSLRFKPPVAKTWDKNAVFDATGPQTACLQDFNEVLRIYEVQSEDCLHLDVYTPNPRPEKAPVMVFIHGGGFTFGIGTSVNTSQVPMAGIGDVIVVNINYRLSVFGFFSTGDDVVSGNMGLKDQNLALKWVHDNIAEFGGNPDMVTIYGESAGGISVAYHVVSPMSKGLFHRAIMQSGTMMKVLRHEPDSKDLERSRAYAFGRTLGCNDTTSEELVKCLQSIDSKAVLSNCSINTAIENNENPMQPMFVPNNDGEFMPEDPEMRFDDVNAINDVDVMLGSLSDEGSLFAKGALGGVEIKNRTALDTVLIVMSPMLFDSDLTKETIKLIYLNNDLLVNPELDHFPSVTQIVGDFLFVCPTDKTARQLVTAGKKNIYLYHITHVPSQSIWNMTGIGAAHGEDLLYVFGIHYNEHNSLFYGKLVDEDVRLTNAIITYWSNFAKTGDPNNSGGDNDFVSSYPEWPRYTLAEEAYKEISTNMQNGNHLKIKECSFINNVIPKIKLMEDELKRCASEDDHEKSKYTSCQSGPCGGDEP